MKSQELSKGMPECDVLGSGVSAIVERFFGNCGTALAMKMPDSVLVFP